MLQRIKILNKEYEVIDTKERLTIPDCIVDSHNKTGIGHGEAKFYVGSKNSENFKFFDDFSRRCFFLKNDFIEYLNLVKDEYEHPSQPYRKKDLLKEDWKEHFKELNTFSDFLEFKLDFKKNIVGIRMYLNSEDKPYLFMREISLPNITYLSVLKLKNENGEILYYFKLFVDFFGEESNPHELKEKEKQIQENKKLKDKNENVRAREGQGEYRKKLLYECPFCPITMVNDERLLIASHIKPWIKSDVKEQIDPKNGFILTPTYDKLFDRGFITFEDDGVMRVSPWISPTNQGKLKIRDGIKIYRLPTKGKEKYLKYHRENVFHK